MKDKVAAAIIARRLTRVAGGNLGDAKSVGEGVSELRIDRGPGYRIYFSKRGGRVIILLYGGDKGFQARDIARAQAMAKEV